MGHAKKLGTPGKTTIPPEVVSSAIRQLVRGLGNARILPYNLFVVPQQCYLYVETGHRDWDDDGPPPPITKGSVAHKPLGRLKYLGDPNSWEYQRYKWSDEHWDEKRGVERGTIKELINVIIIENF